MRIIFFAGKGGVGKTSIAAATGVKAAAMGYKTVILSLDVAHSLSDVFDLDTHLFDQNKGQPRQVVKNLWIQELDIQEEIGNHWKDIHKYFSLILNTSGLDEVLAEELAVLPGMEEVSLLLYINRYVRNRTYDVILLDCAPTGESMRFISVPTTLEWYMKKIFRMERTVVKYVRPVARRVYDVPLPEDAYFGAVERLFQSLQGVDEILTDPSKTSVRLVTNPEKVVLKETQRAFMYFCLHKMRIDGVIMNRVMPSDVADPYFRDWKESQRKCIEEAKTYFDPVPLFLVPLCGEEVLGMERLKGLSERLYGDVDPLRFFFSGTPYEVRKLNGRYRLSIKLPFVKKGDVELLKKANELIIRVGSLKRHILLPRPLAAGEPGKAKFEGEHLEIYFKGDGHEKKEQE